MNWLYEAAIITGMFALRLGVPLAITLLVGYWLRRLDAKWQAEALVQWEAARVQQKYQDAAQLSRPAQPCWEVKGCSEERRAACPAFHQPGVPCYMVFHNIDGRLPEKCYDCTLLPRGELSASPAS